MSPSLAAGTLAAASLSIALSLSAGEKPADLPGGYKLLYEQKFDGAAAFGALEAARSVAPHPARRVSNTAMAKIATRCATTCGTSVLVPSH